MLANREDSNDLFGSAVQIAARICDIAQADAVLVSAVVKDAWSYTRKFASPRSSRASNSRTEKS